MATPQQVKGIMSSGGGFILPAAGMSEPDLRSMAHAAKTHGVTLTLKGVAHLSDQECRGIASAGKGHVIFDLT